MKNKWLIAIPILMVMLGLCVLMALIIFKTVEFLPTANLNIPFLLPDPFRATSEEDFTFETDDLIAVEVRNPFGNLSVNTWEKDQVGLVISKAATGMTQEKAEAALNFAQVTSEIVDGKLLIRVDYDSQESTGDMSQYPTQASLNLMMPATLSLQAASQTGGITVQNSAADLNLSSDFGWIELNDSLGGEIITTTRSGSILGSRVQTGAKSLTASTDFGLIQFVDLNSGSIMISSKSGEINLERVESEKAVQIESNFGRVSFSNGQMESLEVVSRGGDIFLSMLDLGGDVNVSSDFGMISLEQVWANSYHLRSRNGSITVNGCQGMVNAISDYGEIDLKEGLQTTLSLQSGAGTIHYSGSLGAGPHSVSSDFGEINLELPKSSRNDVDIQTRFGEIHSDFEIAMSGALDQKHWAGTLNGGGEKITIRTQNGNINIYQFITEAE